MMDLKQFPPRAILPGFSLVYLYTPALFLEKQILNVATDIEISVKFIYWVWGIIFHGNFPVTNKTPSFK